MKLLVLGARRSCLVCPVPGFYWVNEKGRVTEWRSEDCPSACSLHYVPYIHAISFIDGSSQVQPKQITAELELEPRCPEFSASMMSFRDRYHQKITRNTHGKGAAMSSGHWIKSCQLLHDAQQLCIKVSGLERYFPGWAWPTAGSCFLSGEQQLQTLVLSEDEWNHSGVQFLPSSWAYLHYFRWSGLGRPADTGTGMVARLRTSPAGKAPFGGEREIWILSCTGLSAAFFTWQCLTSASFFKFFVSWNDHLQISSFW